MRSFGEIRFRLRQEATNAALLFAPPQLPRSAIGSTPATILPDPDSFIRELQGSDFARRIESVAQTIRGHRFPIFEDIVETGPEIRWRRDYARGIETGTDYFRRIPYLNPERAGDHKFIWELNRHQHLIILAQAFRLSGDQEHVDEIGRQLESWWLQNPWLRGINWSSALEVAFRALSWVWIDHLAGYAMDPGIRERLREELYRHGVYLQYNLSIYFSPNTHLLGEAVALHALALLYPGWPRSKHWERLGSRIVRQEMGRQVRADGSHFEQSSYYHVYALELFLLHAVLDSTVSDDFRKTLRRMADYLGAISGTGEVIPFLGDDDGGNLFHPYGERRRFGARTLTSCCVFFGSDEWPCDTSEIASQAAWWMGLGAFATRPRDLRPAPGPQLFRGAGVAVLSREPAHIVADAQGFGFGSAGHSHAHALSVVCRKQHHDILVDPGTYTYTAEPAWRERFRGTGFHNTVRVDGLNQADSSGPFRWLNKPQTGILNWATEDEFTYLRAFCAYRGLCHERQLLWLPKRALLAIVDTVSSAAIDTQTHLVEQFWHCGGEVAACTPGTWRINDAATLTLPAQSDVRQNAGGEYGWRSTAPGQKSPGPVIVVQQTTKLPVTMAAVFSLGSESIGDLKLETAGHQIRLNMRDGGSITFSTDLPTIET